MRVLIDGVEVDCDESVTIIHEDQVIDTDEKEWDGELDGEVHIKCTHEGIIIDFVDKEGEVAKSAWQDLCDLTEMTH